MLRIYLFSIFTLRMPRALNGEYTDRCTLTITYLLGMLINPNTDTTIDKPECFLQAETHMSLKVCFTFL